MIQTIAALPLRDAVLAYTCDGCKTKLIFHLSKTIGQGIACPICGGGSLNELRNAMTAWVKFHEEAGKVAGGRLTIEIVIPSGTPKLEPPFRTHPSEATSQVVQE